MSYACPNAIRMRQHSFLLCKARQKEGKDYTKTDAALEAFCAYQYRCRISGRAENTERARECFKQHQSGDKTLF